MMVRLLLIAVLTLPVAGAEEPGERVWVALSVLDLDQREASEYHGTLPAPVFRRLEHGTPPAWIRLEQVHWHQNEGVETQDAIAQEWGYSAVSFFPLERVTRIIPLTPERAALLEGRLPQP